MKNKYDIRFIIFAVTFALSCLTVSTNRISGYFGYSTTDILLLKYAVVFCCVFAAALFNKSNAQKMVNFTCICNIAIIFLFIFDFYIFNISGTEEYYRMWWICIIFIANAGFYSGLALCFDSDFFTLSKKYWLGFTPTYFATFLIVFLRLNTKYFSVNFEIGKGLFSYTDYMISNFHSNTWPVFDLAGNIAFFIPVVFMVKSFFTKLNDLTALLVSLTVPFIIEGYQFIFKCGAVDIDDIITNCSGIIIGFIFLQIFKKMYRNKTAV
ncbi:MAG: VanZ family protein [Acetobacter sp.]|nr:VanZ family protein [Bacteroides sp.]MCM1342190.1 VanZ family protein [Acetobacter sp.]MCM1434387.1 VanZ family protein [Clostridiales bacterium]